MPRPKGSKVVMCSCGGRVVGMPGTTVHCPYCDEAHTIPTKSKKKESSREADRRC